MFGISFAELIIISLLALVVMGPEKLPEVARWAGKGLRELREASNTLRNALTADPDQSPPNIGASSSAPASDASKSSGASGSTSTPESASNQRTEIGATTGESPPPSNIDQVDDDRFDEMLEQRVRAHDADETTDVELPAPTASTDTVDVSLAPDVAPSDEALFDVALPPTLVSPTAESVR